LTAIEALLKRTITELQAFIAVIAAERKVLITGDIDQLPDISGKKSALTTRLADLESQREAKLASAGFGAGQPAIDAWLAAEGSTNSTSAQTAWKHLLELAAEARRENEINGKLIATHLKQNQQGLAALLGESADAGTYGANGQQKTSSGRRPLGSA
jgi:flagella synthesis protein FlgN